MGIVRLTYSISPGLMDAFPGIHRLLTEVHMIACDLDPRISTRDLRVEACKHRIPSVYFGWAYPCRSRKEGRRVTRHDDGLVRLFFGNGCGTEDAIRLLGHELRHIGQFHAGRDLYGHMTLEPLSAAGSELDAQEFEETVLAHMT